MNQGQFDAILAELQAIRVLLSEVLAGQATQEYSRRVRPAELLSFDEPEPEPEPEAMPADELPTARRKFKKAKGGG